MCKAAKGTTVEKTWVAWLSVAHTATQIQSEHCLSSCLWGQDVISVPFLSQICILIWQSPQCVFVHVWLCTCSRHACKLSVYVTFNVKSMQRGMLYGAAAAQTSPAVDISNRKFTSAFIVLLTSEFRKHPLVLYRIVYDGSLRCYGPHFSLEMPSLSVWN